MAYSLPTSESPVKLSKYFPRPVRPAIRRLGLEASRVRLTLRELLLNIKRTAGTAMEPVHGPLDVMNAPEELVVVSMMRNAEPWLPTFLRHYERLGANHIVILDNGSTDRTIEIARQRDDVTLFSTKLPYAPYFVVLKRWLVRRFGGRGWTLVADADELFDYPFSSQLPLRGLLQYLNESGFTSMAAQNLEMISKEPLADLQGRSDEWLDENYRFYDVSGTKKSRDKYWIRLNDVVPELQSHAGGLRGTVFDWGTSMLTKLPLVKHSAGLDLFPYDGHFVTGSRVADVSAAFRHYKFISVFFAHVEEEVDREAHYGNAVIFKQYKRVLEENPGLCLYGPDARKYEKPEDLLDDGFLIASDAYREWVRDWTGSAGVENPPREERDHDEQR